ncbi:MAG: beta-lactamase family protein [Candidatus Aminicenantes bacterium]|nr:beta-lactamase family protein [Candidatus Aminicenantes bacterium]
MNQFNRLFIAVVILFSFFSVAPVPQLIGASQIQAPDTPAGKKLAEFLAVVESGDAQRMKTFAESFAASFLEKIPVEDHVRFFQQVHQRSGGLDIVKVEEDSDHELSALLKCKNSSGFRIFAIRTETKPPFAVVDISFGMADEQAAKKAPPPPTESEAFDPDAVVKGKLGMALDMYLKGEMEKGFSGAVLVARAGEKILHKGYSWAVRERRIPVTTKTVFDIGSISKPFTATAVMKLEQEGRLKVSDPITMFFDNVPEDKKAITIHHLLIHSAGLGEYHDTKGDFEEMTRDEAVQHIFDQELKFKPGEGNAYSNSGFTLLAIIVEKVSGKPFQAFLKERVLEPAGMSGTGFYRNPAWKKENVACGYNARKLGEENSPLTWPEITWALLGNGGLVSSAGDLFRFHQALKGSLILSRETKEKSYAGYVDVGEEAMMGYGWGIRQTEQGKRVSHGGANDFGFRAMFIRYLDEDVVIVVTTNAGRAGDIRELSQKITDLIFKDN